MKTKRTKGRNRCEKQIPVEKICNKENKSYKIMFLDRSGQEKDLKIIREDPDKDLERFVGKVEESY